MKWMKRFHRKKNQSLHFEDVAHFNRTVDTSHELQEGMSELTKQFPHMTEKEYTDKTLALFRRTGLDISGKELKMLLALRRETDQMLLREKKEK